MKYTTARTFKLQDGTLCNPARRLKKHRLSLVSLFSKIPDGRSSQGRRYQLRVILAIIFFGLSSGCKNIAECWEMAIEKNNLKFLKRLFSLSFGIPHQTTISRALAVLKEEDLISTVSFWRRRVFGVKEEAASMDGKTLNGVHNTKSRHLLSLFGHKHHQVLGQVSVSSKENEIPASKRLLAQTETDIAGLVITADAFLTQKGIIKDILGKEADYLLTVKKNNKELYEVAEVGFSDKLLDKDEFSYCDYDHGREVKLKVIISNDFDMEELRKDFLGVCWLGKVIRKGKRPYERKGSGKTAFKKFYEESYFISSLPGLTAELAAKIVRGHWSIENNLHWQKDWTFLEDRQRLKRGNAPHIMAFLKGLVIELLHQAGLSKISKALRSFARNTRKHRIFLKKALIISY